MTNKINTFLKAINDQMIEALPSDTVKNPKLNVNSTSSVLSAHSHPMESLNAHPVPLIQSMPLKHVLNKQAIFKKTNYKRSSKLEHQNQKNPKSNEFKDLHLNLSVLEVLARASMYNVILDQYVESLELGKN
ncbi:hypothetical protein Tco_1520600, partial [Tanacetum coccineum]